MFLMILICLKKTDHTLFSADFSWQLANFKDKKNKVYVERATKNVQWDRSTLLDEPATKKTCQRLDLS